MAKRVNAGIVAILLVAALSIGAVIGFFIRSDDAPKTSIEGQITYACEVASEVGEVSFEDRDSDQYLETRRQLYLIANLLGGTSVIPSNEKTQANEYGYALSLTYPGNDEEATQEALDNILDYCGSRQ